MRILYYWLIINNSTYDTITILILFYESSINHSRYRIILIRQLDFVKYAFAYLIHLSDLCTNSNSWSIYDSVLHTNYKHNSLVAS